MNNGGIFFGKGKKNYYGKNYKKNKDKKNYHNNMNYNNNIRNNNININEYIFHNNLNNDIYDDSKINFSITNNSTIDKMSNKNNMNSDYNIIYKNNNIFYYNNKIQRNKQFNNNQNQYIRSRKGYNNIHNHMNNYNNYYNQKQNYNNNFIDNYIEPNMSNKFNINTSFNNINNFYNLNKNYIPNMSNNYQIKKNNINDNNYPNYNEINNNKKEMIFNKLNLNIKLGEKDISKEILIDIVNDDISKLVNDILIEYNLKENYFEPLLNIIEKTINILFNFDKIKPSKYAIKNLEENKNILDENKNDFDNSLILDLIEKKKYQENFNDILYDIYSIKINLGRNLSCSYIHIK